MAATGVVSQRDAGSSGRVSGDGVDGTLFCTVFWPLVSDPASAAAAEIYVPAGSSTELV